MIFLFFDPESSQNFTRNRRKYSRVSTDYHQICEKMGMLSFKKFTALIPDNTDYERFLETFDHWQQQLLHDLNYLILLCHAI